MKTIGAWEASIIAASMAVNLGAAAAYPTSFQTISFKEQSVDVMAASGTTGLGITAGSVNTKGSSYRSDYQAYWLTQAGRTGIEFTFTASAPTLVQMNMRVAYTINSGVATDYAALQVNINGHDLSPVETKNDQWHQMVVELPIDYVNKGKNVIKLSLADPSAPLFVQTAQLMPRNIYAKDGVLDTTIFAQFGATSQVTGAKSADASGNEGTTVFPTIWTRAYGLQETTEMIPGPTFFYKAGDLLQVNLVNKLNTKAHKDHKNQYLREFEKSEATNLGPNQDETLANLHDQVRQEVNIPHNLNNTNLHVHGLHVDPEKDDVTIVIVPDEEGDTVDQYDAPPSLPTTPEELMCTLDEGSVSDQPVKPGNWPYVYRLPEDHLPGTHWFHPHKHGSTAAQVENGMAGSMVIQEPKKLAIFPKHLRGEWSHRYDRVMMIQQIANYGLQQGTGNKISGGQNQTGKPGPGKFTPDTVINGKHQPTYKLPPGQIVRWRFVNAGANHQAFNHMWLGEKTSMTVGKGNNAIPVYKSLPMYAVAFDGITTDKKVEVTAENPLLLAPGNRTDVLIQVPKTATADSEYALFKYYPSSVAVVDPSFYTDKATEDQLANYLSWYCPGQSNSACTSGKMVSPLMPAFQPVTNPYLFAMNNNNVIQGGSYTENFAGFQKPWTNNLGNKGSVVKGKPFNVAPLIKLKEDPQIPGKLKLDFALAEEFPEVSDCEGFSDNQCAKGAGKWVPPLDGFGGGGTKAEILLTINVIEKDSTGKKAKAIGPKKLPSDTHLSNIAVVGKFTGSKPAYVSPFTEADILQSRPVIFDKSGAAIKVTSVDGKQNAKVNQFTLNGRPFALNDMIGNSTETVNDRLADHVSWDELKSVNTAHSDSNSAGNSDQCTQTGDTSCLDIEEKLGFEKSGGSGVWTNGVCRSGNCDASNADDFDYYWANPGYHQPLVYDSENQVFGYSTDAGNIPTWKAMSGLDTTAIHNPASKYGAISGSVNGVPGLPVATTAEEWIFINNSDIGHPFHIHINPFFVMEVGQLSYEQFRDGSQWVMRAVSTNTLPVLDNPRDMQVDKRPPKPTAPGVYQTTSAVPDFVGNWWDTVIVPPHGYVRMRYWMNVPDQTETKTPAGDVEINVVDNDNKIGVWVYHCHILRHEDRGMMMPVITQQLTDSAPGKMQCPAGMKLKKVKGAHH